MTRWRSQGCNVNSFLTDVSLIEVSWIVHPLDTASLDIVSLTKPSLKRV
jgi:hypothetical protein